MKFLSLEYVKRHTRVDYDCEDDLLQVYAESAEDAILRLIRWTYEELVEEYGEVPTVIVQAAAELTENLYKERSPISGGGVSIVPYNFDLLLKSYMRL